jgi:hypothetical protein
MSKPLVFISHSARRDGAAMEVLNKITARLKRDGFDVWWDQERLSGGEDWRQEINIWLGLCDCAVILFSKKALPSPWVLKEATNLLWRRSLDDSFIVLPVLMPEVERSDLNAEEYKPLAINEIQATPRDTATGIARKVSEKLAPLKESRNLASPLRRLENVVASSLREIEIKQPTTLIEAAECLGEDLGPWQPGPRPGYSERLARLLLRADLSTAKEAMRVLAPHFNDSKTAYRIIDILAIFWINPFAVARLPAIRQFPRAQRIVCVNGKKYPFTAQNYIRRASWATSDWLIVEITNAPGEEEHHVDAIEKEIRAYLRRKSGVPEAYGYEEVEEHLTRREAREPLFIIVPPGLDEDTLDKLREKFPAFIFFLLVGDEISESEKNRLKDRKVILLLPELKPGEEKSAFEQWIDARAVIASSL